MRTNKLAVAKTNNFLVRNILPMEITSAVVSV